MAAATSGVINIVEFTSLEYADVNVSLDTLPSTLTSIGADQLKDGTFNLSIPEESITPDYTEDGEAYNVRSSPSTKTASIGLVMATAATIADFVTAVFTAGSAAVGPTPGPAADAVADELKFGDTSATPVANKYIKVTGKNSEGKTIIVELFNAKVTHAWSGNNGRSQEPAPFTVTFSVLKNRGYDASYQISPAF